MRASTTYGSRKRIAPVAETKTATMINDSSARDGVIVDSCLHRKSREGALKNS